jgi:cytochrome c biogenesis protein CcmG, thiol:disulfide interchange protein DsbE
LKKINYYLIILLLLSGRAISVSAQSQSQTVESEAFRTAARIEDPSQRIVALNKFIGDFPETILKPLAKMHIFKAMVQNGSTEKEFLPIAEETINTFPDIPQKVIVYNEIAYTLAESGKGLDLALKYAEQALAKYPTEGSIEQRASLQDTLGWVLFKRGNYPEAIKNLELSVDSGQEPDTYEHLAYAYEKANQQEKAIDAFMDSVLRSGNEVAKQRRLNALKASYAKKYGSDAGIERKLEEKRLVTLKDKALVKRRYEAAAPAWVLKNIKGETVRFEDLRGKVLALYWWGSWCPPCQHTLPHFQRLYESYKDKGVVFIGMNWERPGPSDEVRIETASNFLKEKSYNFPVILDHDMKAGTEYKVENFPTIFVIDRKGQIRYRSEGFSSDIGEILEMQIKTELDREEKK